MIDRGQGARAGFLVALLAACVLGILAGYLDLNFSEVQSSVLFLLVFTFGMGAVSPRLAWLWALLIGGGVFGAHVVARVSHMALPYPSPRLLETLLALLPAFLGAYLGAGARALLTAGTSRL